MLTPKELEIAKQLKSEGYTTTEILGYIGGTRTGSESSISTTRDKGEGKTPLYSFDEAKQDLSQTWQGVKGAFGSFMQSGREAKAASDAGQQSQATGILQTAGSLAGAVSSGIGEVVKGGIKLALPQSGEHATKEAVGSVASKVMPIVEKTGVTDWYKSLDANSKRSVDALIGTASLGLDIAGFGVAKKASSAVKGATAEVVERGAKTTSRLFPSESPIDMNVLRGEVDRRILSSINDDVDELVKQTRGVEGKTKLMERRNTDVAEILKDRDIFRGLKVEAGKINPDEAIATVKKRKDILMDAKSRMLPSINRFVPVTTRDEVYDLASRAIKGKVPPADEASILARLQRQTNAMPESVSAVELDALRAQFRNAARDARGLQKPGDHYSALENAARDLLFSKIDELPVSSRGEWAQLNNHIKNLINTEEYLDKTIRGQIVKGRSLGGYTAKLLGAIAGSNGGVFGTIAGMELGGMIQSIVMNNTLGSALKLKLLRNIDAPQEAIQLAEQMIRNAQDMRPMLLEAGEKGGARTAIYGTEKMLGVPSDKNIDVIRGTGVKTSRQDLGSSLQTDEVTRLAESQKSSQALPATVPQSSQKGTDLSTATRQDAQKTSLPNNTTRPVSVAKEELGKIEQEISFRESQMNEFPFDAARSLMKFYRKGDKSLEEMNYQNLGTERKSARLDDIVNELGFNDLNEAESAIEKYIIARDELADTKKYYQKVRREVRNGEDVLSYDTPAYYGKELDIYEVLSETDPKLLRHLTRERGAIGKPSNEFLLSSAKRELAKTPNDAKLKAFVSEMELMVEARKYKTAEEFVRKVGGEPNRWVSDKYINMPQEVYRGTSENTGSGFAMYGQGLYTAAKRSTAKQYGTVAKLGRESMPNNPLQFKSASDFSSWEYEMAKRYGVRKNTLYPKNSGPDNLVKALGYDGITIGTGKDMFMVKFGDAKPTMKLPPTDSQLTDIYNRAHATHAPSKSTTQKIKDFLLPPGIDRERGFVYNPFNKTKINAIDKATKDELLTVQQYLEWSLKTGKTNSKYEDLLEKFSDKYGIDMNQSTQKQIKRIDTILDNTKTMDAPVGVKTRDTYAKYRKSVGE